MYMIQLIYISRSRLEEPIDEALRELQQQSAERNAQHNITGLLLYNAGNFLQIVEGDDRVIERLYDTICRDERHCDVSRLSRQKIEHRLFDNWNMGLINLEGASPLEKHKFEALVQACRRAPRSELIRKLYTEFRDQLQPAAALAGD